MFFVNEGIVDFITGEKLFHCDGMDGISKVLALDVFQFDEPSDGDVNSGEEYFVVIKTPKGFSLLVDTIAIGASFSMAARIVQIVHDEGERRFHR